MNFNRKSPLSWMGIAAAAMLMALNYQIFILSNAFAPSGLNGIATMVQHVFHFSVGYMSLLINVPLAVFTFFKVEREFACKTLLFSVVFSLSLLLLQNAVDLSRFVYYTGDGRSTLLAPVVSGAINGFIYACAIRMGGSTGGTDFVAAYVHKHHPEFSLMRIIFVLNVSVACTSYFVYDFNIEPVILCIIYSLITSHVSDSIMKGGERAIKVEIITAHEEELTRMLIQNLRHSVTILQAEGGYSHQGKSMLVCVINKHQIAALTESLQQFPDTFAYFSDVSKTIGNFKKIPLRPVEHDSSRRE